MRVKIKAISAITLTGLFSILTICCKEENDNIIPAGAIFDIDGNMYHTDTIGTQIWMVENLKVTKYRNGDPIPNITDYTSWYNLTEGAYCNYNNNPNWANSQGRLYNWYAVNDSRNIAPDGWHVPSDAEWKVLEMTLGMSQSDSDIKGWRGTNEGSKLAGNSAYWSVGKLKSNSAFGTSGFTALPSGNRLPNGNFINIGVTGDWWSITEYDVTSVWYRNLYYDASNVLREYCTKRAGYSVRCLKD